MTAVAGVLVSVPASHEFAWRELLLGRPVSVDKNWSSGAESKGNSLNRTENPWINILGMSVNYCVGEFYTHTHTHTHNYEANFI